MKRQADAGDRDKTLRERIEDVIAGLPDTETVDLGAVLPFLERDGFLLFCVFLTLPFMVPVSIPGVSTVFGLVILLIGLAILCNCNPPMPQRLIKRRYPTARLRAALLQGVVWVHRIEKFSRPRWPALVHGAAAERINGAMLAIAALLLMAPFGFVPFSNTLPGLAALLLAVGLIQRDGVCILLGAVTNLATMGYFAFLILGGTTVIRELWHLVRTMFAG